MGKVHLLTVALDPMMPQEQAAQVAEAIKMIKGVAGVTLQHPAPSDFWARQHLGARIRVALLQALDQVMQEPPSKGGA